MTNFISTIYIVTILLLILGLKKMSSPKTAESGIVLAGWGMLVAVLATFAIPTLHGTTNYLLMITAMLIGTAIAWYSGKKVKMINMPQMIALYNGMGGGAAAAIAAIELLDYANATLLVSTLAVIGAIIGTISFSGSLMAFAKLQDLIKRAIVLPKHQFFNTAILVAALVLGALIIVAPNTVLLVGFFALLFILGITFTLPVGGANMPIIISLFNAMTGIAVGFNGFVLNNPALMIAGIVVGSSGILLTQLMAKAMNKSLTSILFASPHQAQAQDECISGASMKSIEINDAAIMLAYAKKVIITPGFGMAAAQAQHKIWELVKQLEQRKVTVKFAIHPVAGRMPGHMNVLLAEAGVPYDKIFDLEEINPEFSNTQVGIVIGANDVVNPAAQNQPNSPIYGMPILDIAASQNVLVIKRGQGKGFSGVENSLFAMDNVHMLYGDGQDVANKLIQAVRQL